jgi:hypothetical protein
VGSNCSASGSDDDVTPSASRHQHHVARICCKAAKNVPGADEQDATHVRPSRTSQRHHFGARRKIGTQL